MIKTKSRSMQVRQLMHTDVKYCTHQAPLNEAARMLWEEDCGVLPVLQGERVVAMLTDRDICMAAYTQDRPLSQLRVSTAMSKRLVACRPEDDLETLQSRMREHQVRRVPVVDGAGRLLGIVSLNDLAREAHKPDGAVSKEEVTETLAWISEPRRHTVTAS